jgi:hypothetical protein
VFAPPRKYLTAARLPSDLGLQAKEVADDDREEDIHSARERLAKLIVGRILVKLMIVSTLKKISSKNGKRIDLFWRHHSNRTFFFRRVRVGLMSGSF